MRRRRRKGPGRTSAFGVGVLTLAIAAVVLWFGFTKAIPFRHHFTVSAVFPSANDIRTNAPVRIAGVQVGKVTRIAHAEDGAQAAVVTMRIERKGLPIHRDATMKIRPRIFLEGNFFVDVQPGLGVGAEARATATGSRSTRPPRRSSSTRCCRPARRRRAATCRASCDELSTGLGDGGARALNRSIPYWAPAYRDTSIVTDALAGHRDHDLSRFIANEGATAAALDRHAAALKALIVDFDTTAATLAAHDRQLSDAVAELPRTLRAAEPALRTLNAAFPPVRRLIRDARPAVRSSDPTLDAAVPFVEQVRGLVVRARAARPRRATCAPSCPPLDGAREAHGAALEQVRAASSCQNEVVLPWSKDTIDDKAFPARARSTRRRRSRCPASPARAARATRTASGSASWSPRRKFAYPLGTGRFFFTGNPIQGVNPPVPQSHKRSPLRPDVPCETQQPPDLRTIPQTGPQRVPAAAPSARPAAEAARRTRSTSLRTQIKAAGPRPQGLRRARPSCKELTK